MAGWLPSSSCVQYSTPPSRAPPLPMSLGEKEDKRKKEKRWKKTHIRNVQGHTELKNKCTNYTSSCGLFLTCRKKGTKLISCHYKLTRITSRVAYFLFCFQWQSQHYSLLESQGVWLPPPMGVYPFWQPKIPVPNSLLQLLIIINAHTDCPLQEDTGKIKGK
jgi:hypothetical protein